MIVSVVGKGRNCPEAVASLAYAVGRVVAERGDVVVTGGLRGVMEEAARGAQEAGGQVIGLLPGQQEPNRYCSLALRLGLPEPVRNVAIASCCDVMVCLDGSHGTLQEIAVAVDRKIPVASVGTDRWSWIEGVVQIPLGGLDTWLTWAQSQTVAS